MSEFTDEDLTKAIFAAIEHVNQKSCVIVDGPHLAIEGDLVGFTTRQANGTPRFWSVAVKSY